MSQNDVAHSSAGDDPRMEDILAARRQAEEVRHRSKNTRTSSSAQSDRIAMRGSALDEASIGGYALLHEVHRGGQGVVYEALQKSTQRRVAVKVMHEHKPGDETARFRFERETHVLGRLNHPNIVTIHDSGSAAGHAYFVMDYVAGVPLDTYVKRAKPTIKETLELFLTICDAVHEAHVRGIIHRDLKPGNILVDDRSRPRILDFGLAKLTGTEEEHPSPVMTETGQFVGSMPWASPEQAEARWHDIDVRSDVYSLGVILYQLLTGSFPYAVTGNVRDVVRNIVQTDPARPNSMSRRIDDEVETILLKCLQKEPGRRYQSAGELARDLRNYLEGRPIDAKRDSGWYVLRKTVRRHRVPVAIITLVLLLLVQAVVGLAVGHRREARLRNQAEQARDDAQRQARIAEEVNRFLNEDLLASASPDRLGREVTVLDVVNAATEQIGSRFGDEPLVEAAIRMTLGDTLLQLGEYDTAEAEISRAFSLRKATLGADHRETLRSQNLLGTVFERQSRFEDAEGLFKNVLARQREALGPSDSDTLSSMNELGMVYERLSRLPEAAALHTETLEVRERILGPDHEDTAESLNNLASVRAEQGRLDDAEMLHRRALDIRERVLGPDHPRTLTSKSNVAVLCQRLGRLDEAEAILHDVLAVRRRLLGEDHPLTLGTVINLASVYSEEDRLEEAAALLLDARKRARHGLGAEHWLLATATNNLAMLYRRQGRLEDAEPLSLEAIELQKQTRGENSTGALFSIANHAMLLRDLGRLEAAEQYFNEALKKMTETLGANHWATGNTRSHWGDCLTKMGRYDEAERELLAAHRILGAALGPSHKRTRIAIQRLVDLYRVSGDNTRAALYEAQLSESTREANRGGG